MKKYKLIKEYPGSPKLGSVISKDNHRIDLNDYTTEDSRYVVYMPNDYPEFWEEIVEKDYEILSFKGVRVKEIDEHGAYIYDDTIKAWFRDKDNLAYLINEYGIESVKRLSDGKVFTVGDKVRGGKIKSIIIENEKIYLKV